MRYAVAVVIDAASAEDAYNFVSDELAKPHPWEGPSSAVFVGSPFEIGEQEEYKSVEVTAAINAGVDQNLAEQALTEEALGGLNDQFCPKCLSLNICQQTREDQRPWACLDCSEEFDRSLEPKSIPAADLREGNAVKAPGAPGWSLIRGLPEFTTESDLADTVTIKLDWGTMAYHRNEGIEALVPGAWRP